MPGVGRKSAQRIAFYLLERDRDGAAAMSGAISDAIAGLGHCKRCRMFAENELCSICAASGRDDSLLCVVESPADVIAVEDATGYRGMYFVLMGHLSPLDGTNPTVEGDATAHFLADMALRYQVSASRIAHGVPLGGELEYVDGGTLSHAFYGRRAVE